MRLVATAIVILAGAIMVSNQDMRRDATDFFGSVLLVSGVVLFSVAWWRTPPERE
jgi:hypothetical protein